MAGVKSIDAVLWCAKILRQDCPSWPKQMAHDIFPGFWQCVHNVLIAITTSSGILWRMDFSFSDLVGAFALFCITVFIRTMFLHHGFITEPAFVLIKSSLVSLLGYSSFVHCSLEMYNYGLSKCSSRILPASYFSCYETVYTFTCCIVWPRIVY